MRYVAPAVARVLSVALALAFVALGVVVLVEVVAALQGADRVVVSQHIVDDLARRRWDDGVVVAGLAGAAVIGLLAVVTGLWPRPPLLLPSLSRPPSEDRMVAERTDRAERSGRADAVAVERRSLERVLGHDLADLDGVTRARTRAGRSRVTVRVDANRRLAPADLDAQVERLVGSQLARSGLTVVPRVRVRRRSVDGAGRLR